MVKSIPSINTQSSLSLSTLKISIASISFNPYHLAVNGAIDDVKSHSVKM